MKKYPHLNNAPLTEAVIDIQVDPNPEFDIESSLKLFKQNLRKKYPISENLHKFQTQFQFKKGKPVLTNELDLGSDGIILKSKDLLNIAQFRLNNFTFSRLKPYSNWKTVFNEFKKLWNLYNDIAIPLSITRIATRYINKMDIEKPIIDISDYIKSTPTASDGMPNNLLNFISRITVQDPKSKISANITKALDSNIDENYSTIIFDIDVYIKSNFSPSDKKVFSKFEELRNMKNRIFFGNLTDKAIGLYV